MINFLADDYDGCGGDGRDDDAAPPSWVVYPKYDKKEKKWEAWLIWFGQLGSQGRWVDCT